MSDEVIDQVRMPGVRRSLNHAAQRSFGGYVLEAQAAARAVKSAFDRQAAPSSPFVIFGRGRSGSTLLVSLLDSHPEITCLGEILRYPVAFPNRYIDNCLRDRGAKAVGFKLLSYQLRTGLKLESGRPFLRDLADRGFQLVYLYRSDLFRHALSNLYASKRGVYHQTEKGAARPKIRITAEEMLAWMEGSEALGRYERDAVEGLDFTEVVYERDLANPDVQQQTADKLIAKLGLPKASTTSSLRKVTPESLGDFVVNIDELKSAVSKSRFAPYLDR